MGRRPKWLLDPVREAVQRAVPEPPARSAASGSVRHESRTPRRAAPVPAQQPSGRWLGAIQRSKVLPIVITQGKSRMRENCTSGSVRGVARKGHPYRDRFDIRGRLGPRHWSFRQRERRMHWLGFLVVGLIAGGLVGVVVRGRGCGLLGDLLVGGIGALAGGYLFRLLVLQALWLCGSLSAALVGAVGLLLLVRLVKRA